jgi:ABC-type bacteriocin/lantibiotic exporter with double-glycine peptidase domain
MTIRLPESGPRFLQRDPKWSGEKLGASQETLGEVGCTVCNLAMAANALGEQTNPRDLNAMLTQRGGFTKDGWLVWGHVAKVFGGRVEAVVSDRPSHAAMDGALKRGEYPIVKILLWEMVPHWVVVIGKEGTEYLVRDPLEDTAEPLRLSGQAGRIESVRYVRRAWGTVR